MASDQLTAQMSDHLTSKSDRGSCDCRMIELNVPILISGWLGTGTVIVVPGVRLCMTMWLPRLRTSVNP
jgi:hypothetical protein